MLAVYIFGNHAYPIKISIRLKTMFLRIGCRVIFSDSEVVKPTPQKAERAWNEAVCSDKPVCASIAVANFVIMTEKINIIITDNTAIIMLWF